MEISQAQWFMLVIDVRLGYGMGFEYPMDGDWLTKWKNGVR